MADAHTTPKRKAPLPLRTHAKPKSAPAKLQLRVSGIPRAFQVKVRRVRGMMFKQQTALLKRASGEETVCKSSTCASHAVRCWLCTSIHRGKK
jgi:hypothetical protein